MKNLSLKLAMVVSAVLLLTGCEHALEVKNLASYRSTTLAPLQKKVSIGIIRTAPDVHTETLIKAIGVELAKYAPDVVLPYSPASSRKVDVLLNVGVTPRYKGSGWNFLINWPGFLIWTPAWHGYVYRNYYDFELSLTDASTNTPIDSFSLPIYLNIRHADIGRTWTEISWLEASIIAFIGGLVFISYDDDVTQLVIDSVKPTLGDYVAQEVIARINAYGGFAPIPSPPGQTVP